MQEGGKQKGGRHSEVKKTLEGIIEADTDKAAGEKPWLVGLQ